MNLDNIISDFMHGISSPIIKLPNGLFVTCTNIEPAVEGKTIRLRFGTGDTTTSISIVGYPTSWAYNQNTGSWYQNIGTLPFIPNPGLDPVPVIT